MRGELALFAAEPAVLLNPTVVPPLVGFLAAPAGPPRRVFHSGARNVLTRSRWACGGRSHLTSFHLGHPHRRRPHPVTGRWYMQDFSSSAYWNKVYTFGVDDSGEEAVAEWHVEGEVMANAVKSLVGDPAAGGDEHTLLNIGCGKSTLWESMYDIGWRNITNIDFSATCIEQGRRSESSQSRPGVQWWVMDACSLTFDDNCFDIAVDKGTLDAIACSEAFDWLLPRMAGSVARVLRPGGTWVCVSFTPPEIALPLLEECAGWRVNVQRLEEELLWVYVGRKHPIAGFQGGG